MEFSPYFVYIFKIRNLVTIILKGKLNNKVIIYVSPDSK